MDMRAKSVNKNNAQGTSMNYFIILSIIILLFAGAIYCYSCNNSNNTVNKLSEFNFFDGLMEDIEFNIKDLVSENEVKIKNNQRDTVINFHFDISQNYFDVLLIGKTGVGKSTLINSLLHLDKKERARVGHTEPTTKKFTSYTSKKLRGIRMWDSEGLSLKNNIDNVFDKINSFIEEKQNNNDLDSYIDVILYCINSDESRFEDEEANLVETLKFSYKNTSLPILIVFTRSVVDENYKKMREAVIDKSNIKNTDDILRVQAIEINQTIHGERKILVRNGLYELISKILDKIKFSTDSNTQQTLEKRIINQYTKKILKKNQQTEEIIKNKQYNTLHEFLEVLLEEYDLDTSKEKMEDFEKKIRELYINRINVLMKKINGTNIEDINSKIMINFINKNNKYEFAKIFQGIINKQLLKMLNNCLYGKGERTVKTHLMRQIGNAIDEILNDAKKISTTEEMEFNGN